MKGVLAMAYGSPSGLEDVERYYTRILEGRMPPAEMLSELKERYAAIGGTSPLPEITSRQASALQRQLKESGMGLQVRVGMKYSPPFIGDSLQEMTRDGVDEVVVLPLTPFNSSVSAESYIRIARSAVESSGQNVSLLTPLPWHLNDNFLACWTGLVEKKLEEGLHVVFTAHSIPKRFIDAGEPYARQVREVADEISRRLGIDDYEVAFQSAARMGGEWIGPSLDSRLRILEREGKHRLLIAPIGFVSEHLEVLYDIDIEAASLAESLHINLKRTSLPGDSSLFIKALSEAVTSAR